MHEHDDQSRVHRVPGSEHGDLPRPATSRSKALLTALVAAWDTDDRDALYRTVTLARDYLSAPPVSLY